MRRGLPTLAAAAIAAGLLSLTSCAAGAPAGGGSPSPTTGAGATTPTPTTIAAPTEVGAPVGGDAGDLTSGAPVPGGGPAAGVGGVSRGGHSVHEVFTASDGSSGQADIVFGDAPAMAGAVVGPSGTTSFVLTPDAAWVTIDGAWVEGDTTSTDSRKMLAGTIGQAYRAFADPSVAASLISASGAWTVQAEAELDDLPGAGRERAWPVQAGGPFSALGTEVQEMTVWLSSSHVPIGVRATVSVGGIETTTVQRYSAWGMPVDIALPQP